MSDDEIVVSICCITYNHGKYIREAIESFLNQKTNFKYEIIIQDDCSKDETREIIEKYVKENKEIIKPIYHSKNEYKEIGAAGILLKAMKACKGKYIAICEGDDYWCDNTKLQQQVDYMEKNPDCTFCFHDAKIIDSATNKIYQFNYMNKRYEKKNNIYNAGELELYDCIPTASYMFRNCDLKRIPDWYEKSIVGDKPLQLIMTSFGYAYKINKSMSVYRIHTGISAMDKIVEDNKNDEKARNYWNKVEWIIDQFNDFTDYKFDKYMKLSKLYIEKNIMISQHKYKEILKDKKYKKILKITDILKLKIKLYFPNIYKMLRK